MVTRVENRNGKVLEAFADKTPETVMATPVAQTLLDVLRGAVDQGTGTPIRNRYGIRADVAGKTGTTQGNTDGWFILMQPQLVAGAWVGFNDNRVTMGERWGQGAQSALPIVGEFYRLAIRGKVIDPNIRFVAPRMAAPEPVELPPEPPAEPQLDANGQTVPAAGEPLETLIRSLTGTPALDAGTRPAGNTPRAQADAPAVLTPPDVQPADRR
jgi:penicillin-binding protein 1A